MIDSWIDQNGLSESEGELLEEMAYCCVLTMSMCPRWDADPNNEEDVLNMMKAIYSSGTGGD